MNKILQLIVFSASTLFVFLLPITVRFKDTSPLIIYLFLSSLMFPYLVFKITSRQDSHVFSKRAAVLFSIINLLLSYLYLRMVLSDSISQIMFF